MAVAALNDAFNDNRVASRIAVEVAAHDGVTRRTRVFEDGSMRVRFPNTAGDSLEAVLVNTAGGMTGGDRFALDLDVGVGARLTVSTTAAEKIYRSNGPDTELTLRASIASGGQLVWLPQETILFDQARLGRRVDVEMAADASLVFCESMIFGRTAMGEAVRAGKFIDRWRIRRGGKLLFADTLKFDGAIGGKLGATASAAGAVALATLLIVPGNDTIAQSVRELDGRFAGEVGVSAWNGLALVRFCARDGAALRKDVMAVLGELNLCQLPRLWLS